MAAAPVDDGTLLARLRGRDPEALRLAFDTHGGVVLGAARVVLGDQARAEEIAQAVFLALWERPERVDPRRGSVRTYLVTMARSRAIDVIRSDRSRRQRESADHSRTEPLARAAAFEAPEGVALEVRQALATLPDGEREAIVTAYYGGLTYQEAAVHLGVAEGTLKSRVRSGLAHLRDALTDGNPEPQP